MLEMSPVTLKAWRDKIAAGEAGTIPALKKDTRERLISKREAKGADPTDDVLDLWGLARARSVEKLIDYLREDRRVHELRAEAALNASRAAVLEAEKAPDRSRPEGVSSDRLERMIAEAFDARRAAEAGGGDTPTEKPGPRGKQPPAEER